MTSVSPSDSNYAETYAILSQLLAQEEKEHGRIAEMSDRSFREWVSSFINEISELLAVSAATISAIIVDYIQIGRNAITAAKRRYQEEYRKARRIRPI